MKTLFAFACLMLAFGSCKKSGETTEETVINPENAVAMSSAIKVWHGTRQAGTPPAPTNSANAPRLDPQSNNQDIKAIGGRFAIIVPEVMSGSVAGYYIQVNGAADYFKVDYSKPRNVGGRVKPAPKDKKRRLEILKLFGIDSTGNNQDSAIVITIPENIKPGEFCVTYCVYDAAGNISNPITTCITVLTFGGDASSAYLNGNWKLTAERYDNDPWQLISKPDTTNSALYCEKGKLSFSCDSTTCVTMDYVFRVSFVSKAIFSFAENGGFKYDFEAIEDFLDTDISTCSTPIYKREVESEQLLGAWTYNASAGKLVIIIDFSSLGDPEPVTLDFVVEKTNEKNIILKDVDGLELKLEKQ